MNYLAYYYCLPSKATELHVFGNLLPDIFPAFTKFYNVELKDKSFNQSENAIEIIEGIYKHFMIDEIFHKHALFTENVEFIKQLLSESNFNTKNYVLAHLIVEFLIDRLLLLNDDEIAISFYEKCNKITVDKLYDFFKNSINKDDFTNFMLKFNLFLENEYAYRLIDIENIPKALSNILKNRLGIDVLFNDELFFKILKLTEANMEKNYLTQLQDIKNKL